MVDELFCNVGAFGRVDLLLKVEQVTIVGNSVQLLLLGSPWLCARRTPEAVIFRFVAAMSSDREGKDEKNEAKDRDTHDC